jgi:SAM-dependent methyltransferase
MDNWYAHREKYRPDYNILAEALTEVLDFEIVLDIGSANGFLIDALFEKHRRAQGIELSADAVPYMSEKARKNTHIGDITQLPTIGSFDLVTCIEVAEHIEKEKSEALVKAIVKNAKDYIYFTAATPFQGGRGHINCQPHFFWLNLFRKYGFRLNYLLTERLVNKIEKVDMCYWLPLNSLILRRW